MDDLYTIDTPENIAFAYDIAGIGSRFVAALIDSLLIVIAEVIVFLVAGLVESQLSILTGSNAPASVIAALASLLAFVILWGYYMVFEMVWNGQSIGKRAVRLRVVREGGQPITFVSSAIRNLIRIVDFLPSFYGVGVIAMFIDPRARRLGDLAAGTLVVRERGAMSLESLTSEISVMPMTKPGEAASQPTLPNIDLLHDRDYELVQEFLARRDELGREARARIGSQLASGVQARLGLPQGGDAEQFLQYVAAEYQLLKRTSVS
jgi:uncharacterized RDD family membrane protein YckC